MVFFSIVFVFVFEICLFLQAVTNVTPPQKYHKNEYRMPLISRMLQNDGICNAKKNER
jgi:hypothetical protein